MLQFGNKILEYLESILDKIIESTNRVEDIKSVGGVKTETINLSKVIFTEKGDLYILNRYINDLINYKKSSGIINEILIKSEELINRNRLEKKIYGAWNEYSINQGKLNTEINHWKELDFEYISIRYEEIIQFFNEDFKFSESIYDILNGTKQTNDLDDFISERNDDSILQTLVKTKFDEILFEIYALLDLTLLKISEIIKENKSLNESSKIIEIVENDKIENKKNHIYKDPLAVNAFEKIINDNTFHFTLSDFSQLYRYIEENYCERVKHKLYLEYIESRFKEKIKSSIKSMKIEKTIDSKQTKFANIVNN